MLRIGPLSGKRDEDKMRMTLSLIIATSAGLTLRAISTRCMIEGKSLVAFGS